MPSIKQNLNQITCEIDRASKKSPINQSIVQLLAVSKNQSVDKIEDAINAGQKRFGENYVQEGVEKIMHFQSIHPHLEWHFIGPLQSNKSRAVAEHFDWIHTVDREKIAQRLNDQRPSMLAPLNVLIQVNSSEEDSKSGCTFSQITALAEKISELPNLTLRGIMCIPKAQLDHGKQREAFATVKMAFDTLQRAYPQVDTLSMGMSNDMEAAIEAGSTLVRIGTAIFGERPSRQ